MLRLLATELSGPEIARKLMVSLNTLHTHTKRIYSKLGVNNRRAAVRRARGHSICSNRGTIANPGLGRFVDATCRGFLLPSQPPA